MIRNKYTDLIDEACAKVIPGWEPPVYETKEPTLYAVTKRKAAKKQLAITIPTFGVAEDAVNALENY